MDIQIKTKFEQLEYIKDKLEYLNFDEYLGCYVEKVNGKPVGLAAWMNGAWYGFEQAAKAQAVPEGYVVVPKEPTEAMLRAANDHVMNTHATPFTAYKVMLEAQEQSQ